MTKETKQLISLYAATMASTFLGMCIVVAGVQLKLFECSWLSAIMLFVLFIVFTLVEIHFKEKKT